jgi:hypothetical protein
VSARRFAPPRPLAVATDPQTGVPTGLHWRGRTEPVAQVEATWALDLGWWAGEGHALRRRYFRLLTRGGLLCVVFRDLTSGRWLLERIFD